MSPPETIEAGDRLRSLGFNPLPSNNKIGHPSRAYTALRDHGCPADEFARRVEDGDHGVQVATGGIHGFAVLEADGEGGIALLEQLTLFRPLPVTPALESPRRGLHYWFSVPRGSVVPSGDLFKLPGTHQGLELLGDGRLARCPPSYKTIAGRKVPYRWLDGREVGEVPLAPLPSWVLDAAMRPAEVKPPAIPIKPIPSDYVTRVTSPGLDRAAVLAAITDPVGLARSLGVRVASERANGSGWIPCHSIFREDAHPSASLSAETGRYWEPSFGRQAISLMDLAVALGHYPDFSAAVDGIGHSLGIRRAS